MSGMSITRASFVNYYGYETGCSERVHPRWGRWNVLKICSYIPFFGGFAFCAQRHDPKVKILNHRRHFKASFYTRMTISFCGIGITLVPVDLVATAMLHCCRR